MKTLTKLIGLLALPLALACEPDYPTTPLGLMVDSKEDVDYNALDCHFLDIEKKLGYSNTSKNLIIEVREAKKRIRDDGTIAYYFDCGYSSNSGRCAGLYMFPDRIVIHTGQGTVALEDTALRFELNRYFKYRNDSEDWYCADYGVESPNCFDDYITEYNGECENE